MREWLKELRKEAGLRQKDLADALGWTAGYFCLIEQGKRVKCMDANTLSRIAEVAGTDVNTLLRKELDFWKSSSMR